MPSTSRRLCHRRRRPSLSLVVTVAAALLQVLCSLSPVSSASGPTADTGTRVDDADLVKSEYEERQAPTMATRSSPLSAPHSQARSCNATRLRYIPVDITASPSALLSFPPLPRPVFRFGLQPSAGSLKVFGVGLSRTGTSSLADAMRMMGLTALHFDHSLTAHLPHSDTFNFSCLYDDVDAVLDLPTAFYYVELMAAYPNSLFVSTVRSASAWFDSFSAYLDAVNAIFAPAQLPIFERRLHELVYGSSQLPSNGSAWIQRYNAHYDRLSRFIPPDRLLTIDLDVLKANASRSPFPALCRFLGLNQSHCPSAPYPKAYSVNSTRENIAAHVQRHDKASHVRKSLLAAAAGDDSDVPSAGPSFAYATLVGDINANDFKRQFVLAAMVWCRSVRRSYNDGLLMSARQPSRPFDVVLLLLGDSTAKQRGFLLTCFDEIVNVGEFGAAPLGVSDSRYYALIRAKFNVFGLTSYRRIIFMDADQVVVRNIDHYFFRYAYGKVPQQPWSNSSTRVERPAEVYAQISMHAPVSTAIFSLEPSAQSVVDMLRLFHIGRWDDSAGWMDFGLFNFHPVPLTISLRTNASAPWRTSPDSRDELLPYLPLVPHPARGQEAWLNASWNFYCSWADQGMLFYYFYLLRSAGGIIDVDDLDHEIVHYIGVFKPWIETSMATTNEKLIARWSAPMQLWRDLANELQLSATHSEAMQDRSQHAKSNNVTILHTVQQFQSNVQQFKKPALAASSLHVKPMPTQAKQPRQQSLARAAARHRFVVMQDPYDMCVPNPCVYGDCDSETGLCGCDDDWSGSYCDQPSDSGDSATCSDGGDDCSENGFCSSGQCSCINGYTGDVCEAPPPVSSCSGQLDCPSCAAGGCSWCFACGACLQADDNSCLSMQAGSGAQCSADWSPSPCDYVTCYNGGSCTDGACQCPQGWGGAACDVSDTAASCAGVDCGVNGYCDAGACVCTGGWSGTVCQQSPLSICRDALDCASCAATGVCAWQSGACLDGAAYSASACSSLDPCSAVNCGAYGTCASGVCSCSFGYIGSLCNVAPVDPCAAAASCYSCTQFPQCGWSATYASCLSGRSSGSLSLLSYGADWLYGTGACFPNNPPDLCAGLNCNSGSCVSGSCNCPAGKYGKSCQYQSDPCSTAHCNTAHSTCVSGQCLCNGGWSGPTCNLPPSAFHPPNECAPQSSCLGCAAIDGCAWCVSTQSCLPRTQTALCPTASVRVNDSASCASVSATSCGAMLNCGSHGHCVPWFNASSSGPVVSAVSANQTSGCVCDAGWVGPYCQFSNASCASLNCGAHGRCSQGACQCNDGYSGSQCEIAAAALVTASSGYCECSCCSQSVSCRAALVGTVPYVGSPSLLACQVACGRSFPTSCPVGAGYAATPSAAPSNASVYSTVGMNQASFVPLAMLQLQAAGAGTVQTPSTDSGGRLTTGAIVGIAVGGGVGLLACCACIALLSVISRRKRPQTATTDPPTAAQPGVVVQQPELQLTASNGNSAVNTASHQTSPSVIQPTPASYAMQPPPQQQQPQPLADPCTADPYAAEDQQAPVSPGANPYA